MGRVVIAGSINMDLVATSPRFPAPGETLMGGDFARYPGGKGANQAIAAARLGAETLMIGAVGQDSFGLEMREVLAAAGADVSRVKEVAGVSTGVALITVAGGENAIIVTAGANGHLRPEDVGAFPFQEGDVAAAQLETPPETNSAFFEWARAAGARTLINTAPATGQEALGLVPLADIVVLNETELAALSSAPVTPETSLEALAEATGRLRARGDQAFLVTLGRRGVLAAQADGHFHVPAFPVEAVDTTGAGDCFAGALAVGLSAGLALKQAVLRASAAAALSVQGQGAGPSMPDLAALEVFLAESGHAATAGS